MVAAFLEWFLWLGAFLYCLVKVYQKAEHWSVKILAVIVGVVFTLLRSLPLNWSAATLEARTNCG
jgi:chitin synthase